VRVDYSARMAVSATIDPRHSEAARPKTFGNLLHNREASFWLLQALGWSAYFIAQFVSALFYPEKLDAHHVTSYRYVLVIAAVSGFGLSTLLRYAYRRVRDRQPIVVVPTIIVLVYLAALVWRVFINGGYVMFMHDYELLDGWARIFAGALISTYLLLCWSALYFGIYYYESVQREREATLRATALAQEAQVKMLRYQLNPHFLFNTLNAISTLILDHHNDTANQAVTRLSAFLRHTLDQDPMKKVTLQQELEALDLYLGIEKLRFGPRLRLQRDVHDTTLAALVPSLLLQPLVENALKYAIAPAEAGGTLHIGARLIGQRLMLHVADDGPGLPDGASVTDGRGVGLRNTRERLAVLYGDRARFASHNTGPGLRVDIEFPAEFSS
jgi:two-component sensor histidine kinase